MLVHYFPTLKRGANERCAYGADVLWLMKVRPCKLFEGRMMIGLFVLRFG
jgi:hypothetical protein